MCTPNTLESLSKLASPALWCILEAALHYATRNPTQVTLITNVSKLLGKHATRVDKAISPAAITLKLIQYASFKLHEMLVLHAKYMWHHICTCLPRLTGCVHAADRVQSNIVHDTNLITS